MQENSINNSFTWRDFLFECLTHWRWFVASLVICLSVAAYKIASSNDIYESTASVLIKSEDKNSNLRQVREAFNMMGFGGGSSNVHNEMLTMASPTLMAEVIEKMRLNEIFTSTDGLKKRDLYKQEPLLVMFENPHKLPKLVQMDITIVSNSEYELKNFKKANKKYQEKILAKTGNYTNTPLGKILLSPTTNFSKKIIGKTIHYVRVEPMQIADSYVKSLKIEIPDREASVINLSFRDNSPAKSTDLITTLIDVYNENWVANRNAKIKSITEMVNERINVTLRELNEAETNISSYMSKNLVADFDQASTAYFRENMELSKQVMEYRTQVNIAKSMLASLNTSEYLTLPANTLSDNTITSQIHEYNQLVLERNKLLDNSNPNNAVVSNMTKSLQVIREGIAKALKGLISNTNMTVSSLEKHMSNSQQHLAKTPIEARSLANIKREQKIKEELYLFLLEKKEENDMSQYFATDNSQVIVTPHSTMLPIAPNKQLIIMASLIMGFAIPVAILLLLTLFDTTVHSKKDLESLVASFVGEVPYVRSQKRWKLLPMWIQKMMPKEEKENFTVMVKKNNRNVINEAFRVLRTNLDFMNKECNNKVFIVTSIHPGSGKSFISMNLATSYALKGSKVLVIDMDLRRATASKYLGTAQKLKGIADYLGGYCSDYKDIISKNAIVEGIDMIPVGTMPPNPAELILSEKLSNLISQLRQQYDYIFLDCPPIGLVAESGEIARYADMAIFVVRAGMFEKSLLPEIDELYNKKVFSNMVVMLNAVTRVGHYGYGKYGYGKYGYHSYYNNKD